jgi:hypothetical protein
MEIVKPKAQRRPWIKYAILLFVSILLLAYVDYIVLEKIYHPIAAKHNIIWNQEFNAVIFGHQTPILRWQLAFMPLGVCLFILLGWAARSYRLAISGILLFACGWEDIFYYVIQGKWLPAQLGWLDYSPIMGLTKYLTRTEHVTSTGILISTSLALLAVVLILYPFKKSDSSSFNFEKGEKS